MQDFRSGFLGLASAGLLTLASLLPAAGQTPAALSLPPRIISLDPSATEFLYALGAGNRLVGVSDSSRTASEAALPRVGGMELNLERISRLQPTHIIDLNGRHKRYELLFRQIGFPYLSLEISQLEGIPSAAVRLAEALNSPEQRSAFLNRWQKELEELTSRAAQPRPRVYIELWDAPLQAAGRNSLIGQLVRCAGGENILASPSDAFPVITPAEVLKANPEVILVAYPVGDLSRIGQRPGWGDIDAVRKNRVFAIDPDELAQPSPLALKGLRQLINLLKQ
ncbi:MAG TPA: helical backbone metal receptor [Candidatus Ozemobacteraceae bacterium]|nr:helical backbone metal receptor [Candidatus Ozemobacteraceae bacterium]